MTAFNFPAQSRFFSMLWVLACAMVWMPKAGAQAEAGQPGTFEKQSIEIPGGSRDYRLFVPDNYDPQRPIGIVFGFQSYGSPDLNLLPTFEQCASNAYWICISVPQRGPGDGGYEHQLDTTTNQDLIACQAILDLMRRQFAIDPDRVFAYGISSGALFALTMANAWPGVMAAICPVAAPNWDIVSKLTNTDYGIIGSGGMEDSYRAAETLLHINQYFKQHGADGEFHLYNRIAHRVPPADPGITPEQSFEAQVCEYFLHHPRNSRSRTHPPVRMAADFQDEFEGTGTVPSAERWRVESFAADTGGVSGAMGDVNGYGFRTKNGWMTAEGFGAGLRGGICFTGFVEPRATWRIAFVNDTRSTDSSVWPLVIRDMRGRIVALSVTSDGWRWGQWDTGMEFRAAPVRPLKVVTMDAAVPTAGVMILDYDYAAHAWRLSDAQGNPLAEGFEGFENVLEGAIQFGFGVRGNYCEARFDWVNLKTQE
jgi:predicted esterase